MTITERVNRVRVPELVNTDDRQRIFRSCLTALAEPGRVVALADRVAVEDGMTGLPAPAAPILVLGDPTTPIAAFPDDPDAVRDVERLAAITHAPTVPVHRARYALAYDLVAPASLRALCRGSHLRPQDAAMLVQGVASVTHGRPWRLSGPGIAGTCLVSLAGPDEEFFAARAEVVAGFPTGVDILLCDPAGRLVGLPRTTRIEAVR